MDQLTNDVFKLPQEWYEEGAKNLEQGKFEEARNAFEKALELDPFYPQALCGLSKILWQQGNFKEAVETINKALEIDSNDPDVIKQCADIFIAVGQKNDAIDVLRSYLERNPWDVEIENLLKEWESTGLTSGSLPTTAEVGTPVEGKEDKSAADFLTEEGETQLEKNKVDRARMCFEMALEHDPNHAKAHNNLGVILWNEGKLDEALEHFQKAFSVLPEDKDIVFNSFHALVQAGYVDIAKDLIKLHIQKNPFNEEAWELYDSVSSPDVMMHWDPESLSKDVAEVYVDMGKKLSKKGDLLGAAHAFHRALMINSESKGALKQLGKVHKELGHHEEAVSFYEAAISVDPSDEKLVLKFADYLKELDRKEEARELLAEFLKHKDSPKVKKALEELK